MLRNLSIATISFLVLIKSNSQINSSEIKYILLLGIQLTVYILLHLFTYLYVVMTTLLIWIERLMWLSGCFMHATCVEYMGESGHL